MEALAKLMSDRLRAQLGQRLGVNEELVRREGWGAIPTRTCGSLVRAAVEVAEESMRQRQPRR
jgi:small acid-soluble spore protein F (minor alpha/beta-type SASP)